MGRMAGIRNLAAKKALISANTMWPAVILAASRNLKVRGRMHILTSSMILRRGFNHLGAPLGRREAMKE